MLGYINDNTETTNIYICSYDYQTSTTYTSVKSIDDLTINLDYVDLQLPSGKLWAKSNIGAKSEDDYGLYFQWGDIKGYNPNDNKSFSWDDYIFGTDTNITKYNNTDNKILLDLIDDGATKYLGNNWKIPSKEDFIELINNTNCFGVGIDDSEFQINGTVNKQFKGIKFYSKKNNQIYVYFPCSGNIGNNSFNFTNKSGFYWTSSLCENHKYCSYYLYFNSKICNVEYGSYRFDGFPLRAISNK